MDHIDAHLTTASLNEQSYDFALRVAAGLSQKTLNKYYSLTDTSKAYRIAMSKLLHIYAAARRAFSPCARSSMCT